MADKIANFLVDNGTDYDQIFFSTTAAQVDHNGTPVSEELDDLVGHNHNNLYYTKAETTALLDGALLVKKYSSSPVSVQGGAAASINFTYTAPSGYTEVGIIGHTTDSAYCQPFKVMSKRIDVYNTDTNTRSVGGTLTVLFAKNSVM